MTITSAQLGRLHTCCSQMARSVVGFDSSREGRLAWAESVLRRDVTSFLTLSVDEARRLIDAAQGEIGHRAATKAAAKPGRNREESRRHGLDGRRDDSEFATLPQIASADDLAEIISRYERLGWDEQCFGAWLSSRTSPLRGRKIVRTKADANKVLWALKGMLQERGLWVDWSQQ